MGKSPYEGVRLRENWICYDLSSLSQGMGPSYHTVRRPKVAHLEISMWGGPYGEELRLPVQWQRQLPNTSEWIFKWFHSPASSLPAKAPDVSRNKLNRLCPVHIPNHRGHEYNEQVFYATKFGGNSLCSPGICKTCWSELDDP